MQTTWIEFRGEDREVEYSYQLDKECGLDGVYEWSFTSPEAPEPTEAEYDEIADVLTVMARSDMRGGPDEQ
jgi:hypothetical protein